MSTRYNRQFQYDPFEFIKTYSVDIKTWFERLVVRPGHRGQAYSDAANESGFCQIDFAPIKRLGRRVRTVQVQMVPNMGIEAYWAPYHSGLGLPGYTDVLRVNPPCNFVFTSGMNGCAFVVTDSPLGPAYMRVYHHQHPNNQNIWNDINNVGMPVISYAGPDDYSGGPLQNMMNPVAFNFLYYRNGTWNYVFQPQAFNALSLKPAKRLTGQASMRAVF